MSARTKKKAKRAKANQRCGAIGASRAKGGAAVVAAHAPLTEDNQKLQFVVRHLGSDSPFSVQRSLDDDVKAAVAWIGARTPTQIIEERESTIKTLEHVGAEMWKSGACTPSRHGLFRGLGLGHGGVRKVRRVAGNMHSWSAGDCAACQRGHVGRAGRSGSIQ